MFCESWGKEVPDNSKFCGHCGNPIKKTEKIADEKNMFVALFLSSLGGLGLFYAGNFKKGLIFFVPIFIYSPSPVPAILIFFHVWNIIALYETYKEVKKANGVTNPNLFYDSDVFIHSRYFIPFILVIILMWTFMELVWKVF